MQSSAFAIYALFNSEVCLQKLANYETMKKYNNAGSEAEKLKKQFSRRGH